MVVRGRYQDKWKEWEVIKVVDDEKVYIEWIRIVKRAVKGKWLIDKALPVHISNVMVICPSCKKPTRVGIEQKDGKRYRVCKKCWAKLDK